jgi:site-specific DNA-methyltransferase (cytosine-N4-specific)
MKGLLASQVYNSGERPSHHKISEKGFLKDNGGSIMPNVIELEPMDGNRVRLPENVLRIANTQSNDFFMRTCRTRKITPHPARMPLEMAAFFLQFLTDPGDLVLDPFGGSNTTGYCAERLRRRWVSIEMDAEFGRQSRIRFEDPALHPQRKGRRAR